MSDAEWHLIEPLMPKAKAIGRPRATDLRCVVDVILYIASTGCQWRQLPRDFLPPSTVQRYFYHLSRNAALARINHAPIVTAREQRGREAKPTAGVIDGELVKATEGGRQRTYSAGKKIKGDGTP